MASITAGTSAVPPASSLPLSTARGWPSRSNHGVGASPPLAVPRVRQTAVPTQVLRQRFAPINVHRVKHNPIGIECLQPGDIGFEYKEHGKTKRQHVVSAGERLLRLGRSQFSGTSNALHAFIVLNTQPGRNVAHVADAAAGSGDDKVGVALVDMPFWRGTKFTDCDAVHVFYRFKDPALRAEIVRIARNWGTQEAANFSMHHALTAPWHTKHLHGRANRRLKHLALVTQHPRAPRRAKGGLYKVMCSEFVGNVGSIAAMSVHCQRTGAKVGTPAALAGLSGKAAGDVFDCDPQALTPAGLIRRLINDPRHVQIVGYVPPVNKM